MKNSPGSVHFIFYSAFQWRADWLRSAAIFGSVDWWRIFDSIKNCRCGLMRILFR